MAVPHWLATFRFPEGVTIGGDGNLYIEDTGNFRIREVSGDGTIRSVAGNGQFESTPDGTPAESASLVGPNFLSFDPSGRLLIADTGDFTVRRINSDGTIQTIAGTGVEGAGDGYVLTYGQQANQTLIGTPRQAVTDAQGNIYVSDDAVGVVYKITPDGILNVFAGQVGVYESGSDNIQATSSSFITPQGLALDQNGNLYISDPDDSRIRKVSKDGIITTFAGTGTAGFSGDGGPATQAMLDFPQGIAFDSKGDLIIADRVNNRLRMVTPDGNISTIAGDGTRSLNWNGGPATAASFESARSSLRRIPPATSFLSKAEAPRCAGFRRMELSQRLPETETPVSEAMAVPRFKPPWATPTGWRWILSGISISRTSTITAFEWSSLPRPPYRQPRQLSLSWRTAAA